MYITRKSIAPQNVFLFTNIISLLAWLFPSFDILRKGFEKPYPILSLSGLAYPTIMIFFWSMLWLGYSILSRRKSALSSDDSIMLINDRVYFASALISLVGLLATALIIMKSMSFGQVLSVYSEGKANTIKETLYEDYSLGVVSLRYCVILSGSFVIYRRMMGVKKWWLDLFSIFSLLCVSMISSRLTLIAGGIGGLYLYIYSKKKVRVKFAKFSLVIFVSFLLLSGLNWSRNSNFYEAKGLGFFTAGFSEILTYVGTPVQGAFYALSNPDVGNQSYMTFYNQSTIEPSLTTNSAILDVTRLFGVLGGWVAAVSLFFAGLYISFFERYKSGRYIYCNIAVLYSVVEFWRIFLFFQGIILTLIFTSFILVIISHVRFKSKKLIRRGG